MTPSVTITKSDGNTGVVRPGAEGILAIIAPSASGAQNVAATYTRPAAIVADRGYGRLASFAAYVLGITKKPIVAVTPATSTAAAYGAVALAGTGTSVPTAGGTSPLDAFNVAIQCVKPGTIGIVGITYKASVDGGNTYGPETALGTANSIAIANTGVTIALGAGTLVAGDMITVATTAPSATTADLTAALEALRTTKQPWEMALIDAIGTSTVFAQVDAWLLAMEAKGQFKLACVNTRMKTAGESESAFATAMGTVVAASSTSIRVCVATDGGNSVDWSLGVNVARPASLAIAARAMASTIGTDPAQVDLGALPNFSIVDPRANPLFHNEEDSPGLDALKLSSLRSFSGYSEGAYINNALMFSPSGSDYVYLQHARVMNKCCSLAWQGLTTKLSKGVGLSPKVGPNGERYISEASAQEIEHYVNSLFTAPLGGQVVAVQMILHRDDDISSNQGAIVNADIQVVSLKYIKGFPVRTSFVKTITVNL